MNDSDTGTSRNLPTPMVPGTSDPLHKRTDHSSSIHQKLHEFTLFPKLPVELRYEIWNIAASEPRILPTSTHGFSSAPTLIILPPNMAILTVNKESRSETQKVLKSYRTVTSAIGSRPDVLLNLPDVPINADNDIFFIKLKESRISFFSVHDLGTTLYALGNVVSDLKHIAVDFETWLRPRWGMRLFSLLGLRRFPRLEKITILATAKPVNCEAVNSVEFKKQVIPLDLSPIDKLLSIDGLPAGPKRAAAIREQILDCEKIMDSLREWVTQFPTPVVDFKIVVEGGTALHDIKDCINYEGPLSSPVIIPSSLASVPSPYASGPHSRPTSGLDDSQTLRRSRRRSIHCRQRSMSPAFRFGLDLQHEHVRSNRRYSSSEDDGIMNNRRCCNRYYGQGNLRRGGNSRSIHDRNNDGWSESTREGMEHPYDTRGEGNDRGRNNDRAEYRRRRCTETVRFLCSATDDGQYARGFSRDGGQSMEEYF